MFRHALGKQTMVGFREARRIAQNRNAAQQQALHCSLNLALAGSAIYDGYPCSFNDSHFSSLPIISLRLGGHETIAAKPGVDGGGKKHHQGSSSREFDPRDGRIHASA